MRTDAVIPIVGAHDARNAVSRPTMPASDETLWAYMLSMTKSERAPTATTARHGGTGGLL
jgi:hypothetical protein